MKEYSSSDIRNFAIVGHGASGKTSLSEEIKIMASFDINQKLWFVKAFLQRLF